MKVVFDKRFKLGLINIGIWFTGVLCGYVKFPIDFKLGYKKEYLIAYFFFAGLTVILMGLSWKLMEKLK